MNSKLKANLPFLRRGSQTVDLCRNSASPSSSNDGLVYAETGTGAVPGAVHVSIFIPHTDFLLRSVKNDVGIF